MPAAASALGINFFLGLGLVQASVCLGPQLFVLIIQLIFFIDTSIVYLVAFLENLALGSNLCDHIDRTTPALLVLPQLVLLLLVLPLLLLLAGSTASCSLLR